VVTAAAHEPSKLAGRYRSATIFPKQAVTPELPQDNNACSPLAFAAEYAFSALGDILKAKYARSKRLAYLLGSPLP
jgi:hypothetical protein